MAQQFVFNEDILEASRRLQAGEVIGFSTETFIGLGVNPLCQTALGRLFLLKSRPEGEGVPLIIDDERRLHELSSASNPKLARAIGALVKQFWPGPLTIVVPVHAQHHLAHSSALAGDGTAAVRLSSSAFARKLAGGLGGYITATSANPRGQPPARSVVDFRNYFPTLPFFMSDCAVCNDAVSNDQPSTIVDVRGLPFKILREGAIDRSELSQWL